MIFSGVQQGSTVIDPNSKAGGSQAKLEEDLNRFLNLLITQLKNQDPLDPLDANEFTSQLVQFASVEQQIYQNANLEKLLNLQQSSQVADMVNYLGTTIEVSGQQFPLENGKAEFTYSLGARADSVTITIRDAAGISVYTQEAETDIGKHNFIWDGLSSGGLAEPDGTYTVVVSALDRGGNLQDVTHTVFGRVTGAGADDGAVSLSMGDITVDINDVLAVKETPASE